MLEESEGEGAKIVIMGDGGVGKSCFVNVFVGNAFPENYDATIFDKYHFAIDVDGEEVKVELHDTAGQEEFQTLWDDWIRDAHAMVLLYSVSEASSFDVVKQLHTMIQRVREDDHDTLPIAVCGNKCDLPKAQHQVDAAEAEGWAKNLGYHWCEASAKTEKNVNVPFEYLARRLIQTPDDDASNTTDTGGCCVIL